MVNEKSVGVIVYRRHPKEGLQFLVLYHRGTYWNFPKGHVEPNESEVKTGLRELREETGITHVRLVNNWRQDSNFFFKEQRGNKKELIKKYFVLYLGVVPWQTEVRVSSEHNGYAWLDIKTAEKYLKFKSMKEILTEAKSYIDSLHKK